MGVLLFQHCLFQHCLSKQAAGALLISASSIIPRYVTAIVAEAASAFQWFATVSIRCILDSLFTNYVLSALIVRSLQTNCATLMLRCAESSKLPAMLIACFNDNNVAINLLTQYSDAGLTFLRIEWCASQRWESEADCLHAIEQVCATETDLFEYDVRFTKQALTIGLLCSAQTHVVSDFLGRMGSEYYPAFKVPFVIGDDNKASQVADRFGVPFFYISSELDNQEIQRRQLEIIERYRPDYLGLARYDSVLSQNVIDHAKCPILAVHNSFLPSLKSEKAYSLAYEQGLKLVGATARLVQTKAPGPIVEQEAIKLGPGLSEDHIRQMGQGVEQAVFATALRKLVEHKVMVYNAKTIVFD